MTEKSTAVAIVSGGMDSVTLAHVLRPLYDSLVIVSVDYGQRHWRELGFAQECADRLGAEWRMVDLQSVGVHLAGSALTDPNVKVPHGHYEEESMRATVVPNRNALLLDIAVAIAVASKAITVATAVHSGDHAIYPDCRPEFIGAFQAMTKLANAGFVAEDFRIEAPFLFLSKAEIVGLGTEMGVPFELTWSCYEGGELHCGKCGTCVERKEAFELAGVPDPTQYQEA